MKYLIILALVCMSVIAVTGCVGDGEEDEIVPATWCFESMPLNGSVHVYFSNATTFSQQKVTLDGNKFNEVLFPDHFGWGKEFETLYNELYIRIKEDGNDKCYGNPSTSYQVVVCFEYDSCIIDYVHLGNVGRYALDKNIAKDVLSFDTCDAVKFLHRCNLCDWGFVDIPIDIKLKDVNPIEEYNISETNISVGVFDWTVWNQNGIERQGFIGDAWSNVGAEDVFVWDAISIKLSHEHETQKSK